MPSALQEQFPRMILERIKGADHLIFDVDLTLTVRQGTITPQLANALMSSGKTLGVATSRANNELDEVFVGCGYPRAQLLRGPVILEDGGLIIHPGAPSTQRMISDIQFKAVWEFIAHVRTNLSEPMQAGSPWRKLAGLDAPPVQMPEQYNYEVSASLWQDISNGGLAHIEKVHTWCSNELSRLGLQDKVRLLEIGDGTLRISAPERDKGVALAELHTQGVIDLSKTVYFGDGRNDIPAAQVVQANGGAIIVVDKHCPELMALASFITPAQGPEAIKQLLAATARIT